MCKVKKTIKYRIVYFGEDKMLAWYEEKAMFVPANLHLYVTVYDTIDEAAKAMRKVKKLASGWVDNIFIDSFLKYEYEKEEQKILDGFYFPYARKDVFVATKASRRTDFLASKILRKMELPDNPDTRSELLYYLQKANCEIHTLSNGREYYEIYGSNFGGRGSFVDDGNTIIIRLD